MNKNKIFFYIVLFLLGALIAIYFPKIIFDNETVKEYGECKSSEDEIIDFIEKEIVDGNNDYSIKGTPYENNIVVTYDKKEYKLKLDKMDYCNIKDITIEK